MNAPESATYETPASQQPRTFPPQPIENLRDSRAKSPALAAV